jgi:hypothetical protein
VTLIKLCAFVGLNCNNGIVMHRMENAKLHTHTYSYSYPYTQKMEVASSFEMSGNDYQMPNFKTQNPAFNNICAFLHMYITPPFTSYYNTKMLQLQYRTVPFLQIASHHTFCIPTCYFSSQYEPAKNITYNHSQSGTLGYVLFTVTTQYEITVSLLQF